MLDDEAILLQLLTDKEMEEVLCAQKIRRDLLLWC